MNNSKVAIVPIQFPLEQIQPKVHLGLSLGFGGPTWLVLMLVSCLYLKLNFLLSLLLICAAHKFKEFFSLNLRGFQKEQNMNETCNYDRKFYRVNINKLV